MKLKLGNYMSRRNFILALAGAGGSVAIFYGLRGVTVQQNTEHSKLVSEIVNSLYNSKAIDVSSGSFFPKVVYDRVEYPQGARYKSGSITIVVFEGEGNELIGVSADVPRSRLLRRFSRIFADFRQLSDFIK